MRVSEGLFATEQGELLCVSFPVEPRLLEETLDALAYAPFPINPQLRHPAPGDGSWRTVIEFPAYAGQLDSLRQTLRAHGLNPQSLTTSPMLQNIKLAS